MKRRIDRGGGDSDYKLTPVEFIDPDPGEIAACDLDPEDVHPAVPDRIWDIFVEKIDECPVTARVFSRGLDRLDRRSKYRIIDDPSFRCRLLGKLAHHGLVKLKMSRWRAGLMVDGEDMT